MKLEKDDVASAAFWDLEVCLECPAIVRDAEEGRCPSCGEPVIPAKTVLRVLEVVEDPDEPT